MHIGKRSILPTPHVERFRFVDRKAFDFRGETGHNLRDKGGTLANGNQWAEKGFEPTFGGLVSSYKLDPAAAAVPMAFPIARRSLSTCR